MITFAWALVTLGTLAFPVAFLVGAFSVLLPKEKLREYEMKVNVLLVVLALCGALFLSLGLFVHTKQTYRTDGKTDDKQTEWKH